MSGCCPDPACGAENSEAGASNRPEWRRVLWIALILNGCMFGIEFLAGVAAGSSSLKADALDFLGDAANYAISLGVAGMALAWRARAALLKGATLVALGFWVTGAAVWHAVVGTVPEARVMGFVGTAALVTNVAVAVMLYSYRAGDANMRSVWICSRNDAIGNLAVLAAAFSVLGTGAGWPDVIVAAIMASLAITGGAQIIRQARGELRSEQAPIASAAP